jgi:hypothetical protein
MFRRFASASAIPAFVIPVLLLAIILTHTLTVPKAYPLTTLWCFAPLIWGLWAALAPSSWVPQRLPIWGAFLGLAAGLFAIFVLNMPHAAFDVSLSVTWRMVIVAGMVVLYYVLWILVRALYRSLSGGEK